MTLQSIHLHDRNATLLHSKASHIHKDRLMAEKEFQTEFPCRALLQEMWYAMPKP